MTNNYLPLTEYSSKYKVSISTLRRKIKADDIQFTFEDGKYLILDNPLSTHQPVHRPSQSISEETVMGAHKSTDPAQSGVVKESVPLFRVNGFDSTATSEEPVLNVANRLLTELKKAYSQILQEKEEQILHLKEEVSDLKTLARVLETENIRLNSLLKNE